MNDSIKPHVQHFDEGFGDIDTTASGRAAAAAAAVHAQYEGLIDAIGDDKGLSPEQRAVVVFGLRQRQRDEARGASETVMAAATNAASGRREMMRLAQHRQRPAQQGAAEPGDTARPHENSGSGQDSRTPPGANRQLFRAAANTATRRAENPTPKPRRRRSGETQGAFGKAARPMMRRAVSLPPEAYAAATAFLSDTHDWLNLWQDDLDNSNELDVADTAQNYLSPHL